MADPIMDAAHSKDMALDTKLRELQYAIEAVEDDFRSHRFMAPALAELLRLVREQRAQTVRRWD